jgi:hypothetical protein
MTLIPSELSTKINACAGRHIPELVELWNYRKISTPESVLNCSCGRCNQWRSQDTKVVYSHFSGHHYLNQREKIHLRHALIQYINCSNYRYINNSKANEVFLNGIAS